MKYHLYTIASIFCTIGFFLMCLAYPPLIVWLLGVAAVLAIIAAYFSLYGIIRMAMDEDWF